MKNAVFSSGSRIQVINYSPFRGLKGTILQCDPIFDDQSEPFCFYFIALDGTTRQELIWLDSTEVELIGAPLLSLAQSAS